MFIYESKLPLTDYQARAALDQSSGLDYIVECDITASGTFNPEQVGIDELRLALAEFAAAADHLNRFKKALFRKQTREEAGLLGAEPPISSLYTFKAMGHDDLFHGIIGIATESGEAAEILIKLLDGERADLTNVREEMGDLLWYLSRLAKWAETTFLTEMRRNIAKLRARHGAAGFSKERDMNRDLDAEHKLLGDDQ